MGVQLLRKDCRNTIAEIVEYDCIPIFSGSCLSSGERMIKDVIISRPQWFMGAGRKASWCWDLRTYMSFHLRSTFGVELFCAFESLRP